MTKLLNKKIKLICYDLHHIFEIKFGFLRLNIIVKNIIEILLEKDLENRYHKKGAENSAPFYFIIILFCRLKYR